MTIQLLHNTPLWVCARAIRKCWASESKSDTITPESAHDGLGLICGEKDKELIDKIGNKNKHGSTLEHLNYTFDISGISRALLQELARHRHASYSVKSSRYTLKELKEVDDCDLYKFIVWIDDDIDDFNVAQLKDLKIALNLNKSNDIVKYMLPEAYMTSLVMTINARSLQNLLVLRTSRSALNEFNILANELFNKLPEDHKYLFEHCLNKEKNEK